MDTACENGIDGKDGECLIMPSGCTVAGLGTVLFGAICFVF